MARYDSSSSEEPGQYPAPAFAGFGLPAQDFGTGAGGSRPDRTAIDPGATNEPGQYPARETVSGVALDGTGAPGTAGIPGEWDGEEGPEGDAITYSQPTFYKSMTDEGGMEQGYKEGVAKDEIDGPSDWTQANDFSYGPGWNMPGIEGNTPTPGSGQHQTGAGNVLYGGWLKGQRPGTSHHPGGSGPGT